MKHARTYAVAAGLATAVMSLGAVAPAQAEPSSEPCAKQERQVTKAEEALAHVTEVFAHQKTKIERLQERLAEATTPEEQARIQAKLDKAMAQKQHVKKDKKAQQQRLAKAEERLATCLAEQAD